MRQFFLILCCLIECLSYGETTRNIPIVYPLIPVTVDSISIEDFFWYGQIKHAKDLFPTIKPTPWQVSKKDMKKTEKNISFWNQQIENLDFRGFIKSEIKEKGELSSAIDLIHFSSKLALCTGESKYVNILERALYNGVCGYQQSDDKNTSALAAEEIVNMPRYAFAHSGEHVFLNMLVRSSFHVVNEKLDVAMLITASDPWYDQAIMQFVFPKGDQRMVLHVKMPEWIEGENIPNYTFSKGKYRYQVVLNGTNIQPPKENGYLVIDRIWNDSDFVQVLFPTPIRRVQSMSETVNTLALQKGMLIYQFLDFPDGEAIDPKNTIHAEFDKKRGINVLQQKEGGTGWKAEPLFSTRNCPGAKLYVPSK